MTDVPEDDSDPRNQTVYSFDLIQQTIRGKKQFIGIPELFLLLVLYFFCLIFAIVIICFCNNRRFLWRIRIREQVKRLKKQLRTWAVKPWIPLNNRIKEKAIIGWKVRLAANEINKRRKWNDRINPAWKTWASFLWSECSAWPARHDWIPPEFRFSQSCARFNKS